nr:hypothetical protein Iba_chr12bCG24070 [Ipomoea batatas]
MVRKRTCISSHLVHRHWDHCLITTKRRMAPMETTLVPLEELCGMGQFFIKTLFCHKYANS